MGYKCCRYGQSFSALVKFYDYFCGAENGSDYILLSTAVTFDSNTTFGDIQCIEIQIVDDDIYEEDEDFLVTISTIVPSTAAVPGPVSQVTKTIQDNAGRISVYREISNGGRY